MIWCGLFGVPAALYPVNNPWYRLVKWCFWPHSKDVMNQRKVPMLLPEFEPESPVI